MKRKSLLLVFVLSLVMVAATAAPCLAAATLTPAPLAGSISVTNNFTGTPDSVTVNNLTAGNIVQIYTVASGGNPIGGTIALGTSVDIPVWQLGPKAGKVWATVTSGVNLESKRTAKDFLAEPTTTAPVAGTIAVANNFGMPDSVTVTGLATGDIVNIYAALSGGNPLAGDIAAGSSLTIPVWQLGQKSGKVYVSVTNTGKWESSRTAKEFTGEGSTAPAAVAITVVNNVSPVEDTITVTGLVYNDVVKVWNASTNGRLLTAATCTSPSHVDITIEQLGLKAGSIYVSVTSTNKVESARTAKAYVAEPQTTTLVATAITVSNNFGSSDSVVVTGLAAGDIIKVYPLAIGGTALETTTVSEATRATVSLTLPNSSAGTIYVTNTKTGKAESKRTSKTYATEPVTAAPLATSITVNNCIGLSNDTVTVTGLDSGDVIKVYTALTAGSLLGSATSTGPTVTAAVYLPITPATGNIYVTKTSVNKLESKPRTVAAYKSDVSAAPVAAKIVVNNKSGMDDTITVSGLGTDYVVKVYTAASAGSLITSVTSTGTSATATCTQLGTGAGSVYVTITEPNKQESARIAKPYLAEVVTPALAATSITVFNYLNVSDRVTVSGLVSGDTIKVYTAISAGDLLGSATAATPSTVNAAVYLPSDTGGNIYVSKTAVGKTETARVLKAYGSDVSTAPLTTAITVTNKAGQNDSIAVTGLASGKVFKVYTAAVGGSPIATATSTGLTVTSAVYSQLGSSAGNIYVSVTETNKRESARTLKAFSAEPQSLVPIISSVTNNFGATDTILLSGLANNDVIKVYTASVGGSALNTVTATGTSLKITMQFPSATGGSVWITRTSIGKLESPRALKIYTTEPVSGTITASVITVTNNLVGTPDTVKINSGVVSGDVVKVYDALTSGNLLGQATSLSTSATVNIDQLGTGPGSVYISRTEANHLESVRTAKTYLAELTKSISVVASVTLTVSGSVYDGNVQYTTAVDVKAALPSTVLVRLEDSRNVYIPITWADTDTYDAGIAGTYTFTGSWGTLPPGVDNADSAEAPIVDVVVAAGPLA